MSIVSSYISSRAPVFRINVQTSTFIDHILAIVAGLCLRIVIDVVGYEDHKLTGSLVGLWEGVVAQHFIKKSPRSFDPYVAYAVRIFIDFLFTESLIRLVLTFLFTGMGIVFADIAPRVWVDTGLRRFWRHLRRDLYILVDSVPSIPYFARPRTVRFSPSQAPSVVTSVPPSPSVITITTQAPRVPAPRKRPVPGSFPDYVSETDTDLSIRSPNSDYSALNGNTRDRRPTVQTESESSYDPDEGNRSSSGSGTATPIVSEADLPNLPNIEDEDLAREVILEDHKDENTPRPPSIKLPPTPSDTTYAVRLNANEVPPSAGLPQIPDDEDWENISRREAQVTPLPDKSLAELILSSPPADQQAQASSTLPAAEAQPADTSGHTRQPEVSDLDPHAEQPHAPADGAPATTSSNVNPPPVTNNEGDFDLLGDFKSSNPSQTSGSRPSPYAQFDDSGPGFSAKSLWGTSPFLGSPGGKMDIWGDVKNRQRGDEIDVGGGMDDPFRQPQEQDDAQHAKPIAEESGKQQDSAGSGSPATPQEDQNTTSTTPEPTASQSAEDMDPASNEPTVAKPSSTQQDESTGENPAAEQFSSTISTRETDGNNGKAPAPAGETSKTVELTTIPVDDDEPLPDGDGRLKRVLALRQEIVRVDQDTEKLRQSFRMFGGLNIKRQITEREAKLVSLNTKAERWYNDACCGDAASEESDLSNVNAKELEATVEKIVILGLLKNLSSIKLKTGDPATKAGKGRRKMLSKWLDGLDLQDRTYRAADADSDNIVVQLPTS
ncbi:hypothetical protein C0995_010404 [Termitomyces sp. Mi166|nr:hypothetical protein C0995_010404 [Termitomyces sp. Mi166\